MRKLLTALLALPVVALVYLSLGFRRSAKTRVVLTLIVAAAIGLGAIGLRTPAGITAVPPSTAAPILDVALATTIETGESPDAAISLNFGAPMDRASVAALLELDPPTPVNLDWAPDGTALVVRPAGSWAPGTLHTITIEAGALDATGRPMANRIRAVFLTRSATQAAIAATELLGKRAAVGTDLLITFDRAIDEQTIELVTDPPIEGTIDRMADRGEGIVYRFVPSDPLTPSTTYTVSLADTVRDIDGGLIQAGDPFILQTANEPSVVRFRPRTRTADVALDATISVRFTEAMDQASTSAAWSVTANDAPVQGTMSFAEGDTVLVFKPAASFANSQTVVMTVGADAQSKAGVRLGAPVSGTFTTVQKATPRPTATPATPAKPATPGTGGTSTGAAVGSGAWAGVESYYLGLMNCTRTGGTVSSSGACSGRGSNGTAPLWIDAGISSSVSRPYAKLLATRNLCSHFINGNPGNRLAAAGYTSYIWAENLGCRSGDPYAAVLGSHLYFQGEKSYGGGHYVNLMNAKYDRVGLGVWVASGQVRLVVDFYHPL